MIDNKQKKQKLTLGRIKRADLTKEFQEFKQKIQKFDEKNEQIISRIREACTFKKKALEHPLPPSQIVYYDQHQEADSVNSSCDYSNNIVYDGHVPPHNHIAQDPSYPHPLSLQQVGNRYQQPQLYFRNSEKSSRVQGATKAYSSQGIPPNHPEQINMQSDHDLKVKSKRPAGRFLDSSASELEDRLREVTERNKQLQQLVAKREEEINEKKNGQLKFRNLTNSLRRMVTDQLDNYNQEVVIHRMLEFQKLFKRYDNRLKKLNLQLKDALEDRRSHRVIEKSRGRRKSTNKNENNKPNSASSVDTKELIQGVSRRGESRQKSLSKHDSTREREFAQIAAGYESMVKSKDDELQSMEIKLREEMVVKQKYGGQLNKIRIKLEQKERRIQQLQNKQKSRQDSQAQPKEVTQLKSQILQLQDQLRSKQAKERQFNGALKRGEKAKKTLLQQQKQQYNKAIATKDSTISHLEERIKEYSTLSLQETAQMKEKIIAADRKMMEKQCQLLSLGNKLKKIQADLGLKDQKVKQLESIITKDSDSDIFQRSMSVDNSIISSSDIKHLKEAVRGLQEELEQKNQILEDLERNNFQLKHQTQSRAIQNQQLKRKARDFEQELKQKHSEDKQGTSQEHKQLQDRIAQLEDIQGQMSELLQEKEGLLTKNNQLLQQIKKIKEENLTMSRSLIKLKSEATYNTEEHQSLQQKFKKLKEELFQTKNNHSQQLGSYEQKEKKMLQDIRKLQADIQLCRMPVSQLQMGGHKLVEDRQEQNLLNSLHMSQMSFNLHQDKVANEQELLSLRERVRQMATILEVKQTMQKQIQDEYHANLERIRQDIVDKNQQIKRTQKQNQEFRKHMTTLQQQQRDDKSFENYKISLYEEKIVQLQTENNQCRESQHKLNQLLHQLTQNMRDKAEERERLTRELELKEKTIQEMKQIMELRESKEVNRESINSKQKDSLLKDFSLRISADQSEEISDQAEISYFSNISDVFKRDDLLQEKMKRGKTSREEFVKLFSKTSAYIKSLKVIIESKDKRIKTLQRQLSGIKKDDSLQPSWPTSREISKKKEQNRLRTCQFNSSGQDSAQEYKDYDSVQIDSRRGKSIDLMKELRHEKELTAEENKMLVHQIQLLQDQITRAEEQENNLVRIKDLYKDQIKKLMDKNQVHTHQFQTQISKLREELDQSESYHNWEAIKQLFVKLVGCVVSMDQEGNRVKKDERRKELQEFTKVLASILKLEGAVRDRLVSSLRR